MIPTYIKGARGGLFIYDVGDAESLEKIDDWLHLIRRDLNENEMFPIIVVGLISRELGKREVQGAEAKQVAKAKGLDGYIECNVDTGENVEKAFEALTMLMLEQY